MTTQGFRFHGARIGASAVVSAPSGAPAHRPDAGESPGRRAWDPVRQAWIALDEADALDLHIHDASRAPGVEASADVILSPPYRMRPWRADEAETLSALLGDRAIWDHLPESFPGDVTPALAAELIAIGHADPLQEVMAVERDGVPVGQVRLLSDRSREEEAELSYWLARRAWGRGWGSAMVAAYVAASFARHPDLTRLTAKVHPANPASARILEKAGFAAVGSAPLPSAPEGPAWRLFTRGR